MNSEMSSESFHVSRADWNSYIHAMVGNTVKTTKTTPTTKTEVTKTTPTAAKSILEP